MRKEDMKTYEFPQPYEQSNGATLLAYIPWLDPRAPQYVTVICWDEKKKWYVVADSRLPLSSQWDACRYAIKSMTEAVKVAVKRAGYKEVI